MPNFEYVEGTRWYSCRRCKSKYTNKGYIDHRISSTYFVCLDCFRTLNRIQITPLNNSASLRNNQINPQQQNTNRQSNLNSNSDSHLRLPLVFGLITIFFLFIWINNKHNSIIESEGVEQYNDTKTTKQIEKVYSESEIEIAIKNFDIGNKSEEIINTIIWAAENQNHKKAAFYAGVIYRNGANNININQEKAFAYYVKASLEPNRYPPSLNTLGVIYRDGLLGKKIDLEKAYQYFKIASECGDVYGTINRANCLKNGLGVNVDIHKAVSLYKTTINLCNNNSDGLPNLTIQSLKDEAYYEIVNLTSESSSPEALAKNLCNGLHSLYDKAYLIFYWISTNITYDFSYKNRSYSATFLYKKGVCEGYARLFKYMCESQGITAYYCEGPARDSNGNYYDYWHAWNRINLKGQTIYVDCCWASGFLDKVTNIYYDKFNKIYFNQNSSIFCYQHIEREYE